MQEIFSGSNAAWLEEFYVEEKDKSCNPWTPVFQSLDTSTTSPKTDDMPENDRVSRREIQEKQLKVDALVSAYRELGHLYANINPLGDYMPPSLRYAWITQQGIGKDLELKSYGLKEEDMDLQFCTPPSFKAPYASLREILKQLRQSYTGAIGSEFRHIHNRPMRRWIVNQLESISECSPQPLEQQRQWQRDLIRAEEFEKFIHSRFTGQKRFSLEGMEVLIPALRYLFSEAGRKNVKEIVMGMAHRGRLNVLANSMVKPVAEIFAMFQGLYLPHVYGGAGDVKYHMGQSIDYVWKEGKIVHISLVSNPSHLEAVDPVVQGNARGKQRFHKDPTRKKVLPILIHGDAAFSGQGIVAETFNMSQLRGYRTGGTIHIVVNNQIGFTTASTDSRSTFFATDIAKVMPVPIFHVNGDDPRAVMRTIDLAIRWRQKFGQDVVVDIIGYRRLGHNEADEPSFTHPIMYDMIRNHDSVATLYGKTLAKEGLFSQAEQNSFRTNYVNRLKKAQKEATEYTDYHGFQTLTGDWFHIKRGYSFDFPKTGVPEKKLKKIAKKLMEVPDGLKIHRKLERFVKSRWDAIKTHEGINWAFAESLAFASLLSEGYSVRLSGEDCGRGTFSQRHAVWWDISTENPKQYTPLAGLSEGSARFSVYDSPLSEFSVLGFEYGYSMAQPDILVLWEAQFGDFANGAQVIIDQFITAGESKWARHSGLVMLLPHAYEGQGPEHSNAYMERYLTLCAEENIQVMNLTTPAQYFHALRKQLHQKFRKPLVIMTPKSLLRLPEASSSLKDFTSGMFQTVLSDPDQPGKVETVILCSGHIWYDLKSEREKIVAEEPKSVAAGIAILRLEQIYPFPEKQLKRELDALKSAKRYVWAQEEPRNRGAWFFVEPRLNELTQVKWEYSGRKESASPAAGSHEMHMAEKTSLINRSLGIV